jgi:RNA polymerase sigma-70 factor (ECF subfamily)
LTRRQKTSTLDPEKIADSAAHLDPFQGSGMAEAAPSTEVLLAAARSGQTDAMGRAFEACRNYLLLVAEREMDARLRAKGGASDVVQQTFLEAHKDFGRFQGTSEQELLAWLRKMLLNNVANFRRHWAETGKRRADREVPLAPDPSRGGASWLADGGPTPSREVMAGEARDALAEAMARLPEDYQLVLRMRYQEGRPFEEIALAMDRSANAVRKVWARAVERLQQELEEPP